ncbi:MAG: hypothetical protein ABI779_16865 [Acidobacteriota bacterium]
MAVLDASDRIRAHGGCGMSCPTIVPRGEQHHRDRVVQGIVEGLNEIIGA